MHHLKKALRRAALTLRLPTQSQFSSNVSFIPLTEESHTAFTNHRNLLQGKMAFPIPGRILHVINRKFRMFDFYPYIAEVESLFSVAPTAFGKHQVDIPRIIAYIESEIDAGKLRKIVFDSSSAMQFYLRWATPKIRSVSTAITVVPPRIEHAPLPSHEQFTVGLVATDPLLKGLFLLPSIIASVRARAPHVRFICVSSRPYPPLQALDGLEFRILAKMTERQRKEFYHSLHLSLNISLGDALSVYTESVQFGVPMVTFEGQNARTYVKHRSTGIIIPSPAFYYSSGLGTIYKNKEEYLSYLSRLNTKGRFRDSSMQVADEIVALANNTAAYAAMVRRHRRFAKNSFGAREWVRQWRQLYRTVSHPARTKR